MTELKIIQGDSSEKMQLMDSEKIHLIVTSPPYDELREYNGHNQWNFEATAHQLYRVLVPGGIVCWNVSDSVVDGGETLTSCKQKIFFVERAGFRVHDTLIWEKPISGMPDSSRYFQTFEYIFVLSKGSPRVFNPIRDRKNIWFGKSAFGQNSKRLTNGKLKKLPQRGLYSEFGTRGNVWQGNTRSQESPCKRLDHHAMMPMWLARDLIKTFSNEGDVVLDPFAGSGTVGWEARQAGRNAIMIDKDKHAIQLMRRRQKLLQPELV